MRFFSAGLRLLAVVLSLAAAPALAQEQPAPLPDDVNGMVGDFILEQEDQSLPKCPITLSDQEALGGWAVQLPETCAAPYPAADQLVAWNIDQTDGSIILLNAERKVVMRLFEDEDGLYDTAPDVQPRFYLMAPYDEDGTGGESDSDD